MIKGHLFSWLIGTLIFLGINLWFGERLIVEQFQRESNLVVQTMGDGASDRIRSSANMTYRFCCNWLADFTHHVFVPPTDDSYGVRSAAESTHQAFWTSIYMVITRVLIFAEWMAVFWVILIASIVQGMTKRSISVTNTAWSSPVRYHLGLHYMVVVFGLCFNYVLWPWSVHPYIAVTLLCLMCFVAYIISSNIQPKV